MADIIQTSTGPDQSGPSALAIVLIVILVLALLFLAWWVFFSAGGPIRGNTTNVNIQQKGGSGGMGGTGTGGTGGGSTPTTTGP